MIWSGRNGRGEVIQINESEKAVYIGKGSVALDLDRDDARSILCQAMMDETVRLRECRRQKERDSIRKFLLWAFQELRKEDKGNKKIADLEERVQSQQERINLLMEFCKTGKIPDGL